MGRHNYPPRGDHDPFRPHTGNTDEQIFSILRKHNETLAETVEQQNNDLGYITAIHLDECRSPGFTADAFSTHNLYLHDILERTFIDSRTHNSYLLRGASDDMPCLLSEKDMQTWKKTQSMATTYGAGRDEVDYLINKKASSPAARAAMKAGLDDSL